VESKFSSKQLLDYSILLLVLLYTDTQISENKLAERCTSVRSLAAETRPKDGTTSFLLTMVVTKSLPDSAKSHVMQAAED
jgi:hypothetical protein